MPDSRCPVRGGRRGRRAALDLGAAPGSPADDQAPAPRARRQGRGRWGRRYWDDFFAEDDVFYGSTSGFKGLERTCVVLPVNGFSAQARAKEMLYVGLSRARSQLVVVGDLDEIAPAGERGGVRQRLHDAEAWQPPRLTD